MEQLLTCLRVALAISMLADNGMGLGKNIERLRLAAGFGNAAEFARSIKVSATTLNDWENGRYRDLRLGNLLRLAKGLKCSVDDLLLEIDPEYDQLRVSWLIHKAVDPNQPRSSPVTPPDQQLATHLLPSSDLGGQDVGPPLSLSDRKVSLSTDELTHVVHDLQTLAKSLKTTLARARGHLAAPRVTVAERARGSTSLHGGAPRRTRTRGKS